jgi:hypothetical protein
MIFPCWCFIELARNYTKADTDRIQQVGDGGDKGKKGVRLTVSWRLCKLAIPPGVELHVDNITDGYDPHRQHDVSLKDWMVLCARNSRRKY